MDDVDRHGGSVAAIENGWMQKQIADSAYRAQQRVETGDSIVVGVNKFVEPNAAAASIEIQRIDPALEREQRDRLAAFRAKRDGAIVARLLADVKRAAAANEALMPLFIDAVDGSCTLGEVCDAMREVFSVHKPAAAV
jgi:methylmalonyl-CoA mutase N-terminal domain/subunit